MKLLHIFILLVIYKITLDIIYVESISQVYEYIGFKNVYNTSFYYGSFLILWVYSYLYKKIQERNEASSLIYLVLYLLYFIPNLSFNTYNDDDVFFIYSTLYCVILTWFYLKFPEIKLHSLKRSGDALLLFYVLLFGVVLSMMIFVVYFNGFNIKIDFENVYEIREKMQDLQYPSFINYLKPISSMFVTAGAMFYLLRKNVIYSTLFFIFGLMLYAFGAHKTDFVLLILTMLLYFFYTHELKKYLVHALIFLNLNVIAIIYWSSFETQIAIDGFYGRTFYIPSLLSYFYYDYYSAHELLYLKEHFLHWVDASALHTNNSPYIIANYYFNDPEMSSNTGLIGSDYIQFGWFSLILLPFLRVYFFKLYDAASKGLDAKMVIISSFTFGFLFINGAFFTALISGGFLIMCFLFYLMPRD